MVCATQIRITALQKIYLQRKALWEGKIIRIE
jgi:hypothetical protein